MVGVIAKAASKGPAALIDPPGPYAPLQEWLDYRAELAASGLAALAPYLGEADRAIARLRAAGGL